MTSNNRNKYWRSLDELQDTPEFREFLHREFPTAASEFPEGVSRRRWMQMMGASLALGGLAGCRWEAEKIAPFAVRPENRIPGKAEKFATSIEIAGMPRHLLVTCYDGRPVKVEGNPDHSDSMGATDTFSQASILGLYDPDRSDTIREKQSRNSFNRSWDEFDAFFDKKLTAMEKSAGEGLALLLEPSRSITRDAMLTKIRKRFPRASFYEYSPLPVDREASTTQRVFGRKYRTSLRLAKAKRIVCFDADLLGIHPTALRNTREFAGGRNPDEDMNRLYSIESQFSVTGAAADHRLPMQSSMIPKFIGFVESLVSAKLDLRPLNQTQTNFGPELTTFAVALADDLVQHQGQSVIAVGSSQPSAVHELALLLNDRLGNIGQTIELLPRQAIQDTGTIADLGKAIRASSIDTLVIIGGNPAYDAPADIKIATLIEKVPNSIRCGLYEDETSARCKWHVPLSHEFESWSDVPSWEGLVSVSQPLIAPLMNGRSCIELIGFMAADRRDPQTLIRETVGANLSSSQWRKVIHDGFLSKTTQALAAKATRSYRYVAPVSKEGVEVVFTPSSNVLDGRFANNGWMQETPDLLTKLTWDNAALVGTSTAEELRLKHGEFARIEVGGRTIEVPVYVMPGQAKNSIGLAIGYGRTRSGVIGGDEAQQVEPVGVDVNPVRTWAESQVATNVRVTPISRKYAFATTQDHHAIDKVGMEEIGQRVNELVREGTHAEYREHPDFVEHGVHHNPMESLWEEPSYDGHAWGMSIDLNKCIGCNACTVACQAENNVPIVGKDQVTMGREMDWIRIDRYFTGDIEAPQVAAQPVACHHCENAPCEQVCPVAATVHSDEGLNDMVYNRCVGTRYCANNCPYKVRRFNFFNYNEELEDANRQLAQLSVNPEVTVRSRGVMEKCTYCVQRIQTVKIDAKTGRRSIEDGEIKTACQQACPAQAIEFGDLNDKNSRVAKAHADSRAYGMLSELNVKPRTKYLARIRNPNPAIEPAGATEAAHEMEVEHVHG